MTERKPPGVSWETWIDKQIREGVERGLFDDLPGTGKPLPDIDKPRDEDRWIKAKLQAEGVSYLPPTLKVRKDLEDAIVAIGRAKSEDEVQTLATAFNRMAGRLEEQTSELRSANTQLETRRAFIEAVLSSVTAGVIALDRKNHILLVNRSAETLLHKGQGQVEGEALASISADLDEFMRGEQSEANVSIVADSGQRTLAVALGTNKAERLAEALAWSTMAAGFMLGDWIPLLWGFLAGVQLSLSIGTEGSRGSALAPVGLQVLFLALLGARTVAREPSMRFSVSWKAGRALATCARVPDHFDTTAAKRSSAPISRPDRYGLDGNVSAKTSHMRCSRARVPARMRSLVASSQGSHQRSG